MTKLALISVSDKSGLAHFCSVLTKHGYTLLSTGGTKSFLEQNGLRVKGVSDYTGSPEILSGRVKTLHPKIHAGLLARPALEQDRLDLASIHAEPISLVVVNLYPFQEKLKEATERKTERKDVEESSLVEFIDIGGPAMLRASAKNFSEVTVICDPRDYGLICTELEDGSISLGTRKFLAQKVFTLTAAYDLSIARFLSSQVQSSSSESEGVDKKICAPVEGIVLRRAESLRYGENPHQISALYTSGEQSRFWIQLQGKELSFNNMVDMEAALELLLELDDARLDKDLAVIIKHTNPCGAAAREGLVEAYRAARNCDPVSAFGGIIALNSVVNAELASLILEGFVEVILAPDYEEEALRTFSQRKNIRLLKVDLAQAHRWKRGQRILIRNFLNEFLLQQADSSIIDTSKAEVKVEGRASYQAHAADFEFAWRLAKHVKSNAVVIVKDLQAIGVGAGQMNRLDSARIAVQRARANGFSIDGSVAASDAFLPFPDTLELLSDAGVVGLVQPGGSVRDDSVLESATKRGITMVITGERHFRH